MSWRSAQTKQEYELHFEEEIKEILVLRDNDGGSLGHPSKGAIVSAYFLAYYDIDSQKLIDQKGRLTWYTDNTTNNDNLKHYETATEHHWERLRPDTIYRVRVRAMKSDAEAHIKNAFYIEEVVEENAKCEPLEARLALHYKPIVIVDEILGELVLDKKFEQFDGTVKWNGKSVCICLEIDIDNKGSWTRARNGLKLMLSEQSDWREKFQDFAVSELKDVAEKWKVDLINYKSLLEVSEITMYPSNTFTVTLNSSDAFEDHQIVIDGHLTKGLKQARLA